MFDECPCDYCDIDSCKEPCLELIDFCDTLYGHEEDMIDYIDED